MSGSSHDLDRIFENLNTVHFEDSLPRPTFCVNGLSGRFAAYAPGVRIIFVHPQVLRQVSEFVSDTILHEMVHLALEVRTGDHAQDHGASFVALANRIAERLGLGALDLGDNRILTWPQSMRPVDLWK